MAPVVGRAVQVCKRLRVLIGVRCGRPQGAAVGLGPGASSAARARTGTGPMFVSPMRVSASCPLERRAVAATPTVAHFWAVRWNVS
jgi:uncharacterized protein (DUF3084 family)